MIAKSKKESFQFCQFNSEWIDKYFTTRKGETRIGDLDLQNSNAKFVILGIEESIGPLANQGLSGAENAFGAFLQIFLNSQVYNGFNQDEILILGSIKHESTFSSLENASDQVHELDEFVVQILNEKLSNHQIPIVIGGGHNNAFPLIKWSSSKGILNVLNLDPHADCRETDRRHSGNPFSCAMEEHFLNEYAVLGLHEAFNNSFIRAFLKERNIKHTCYEDYLIGNRNLIEDALGIIHSWNDKKQSIGFEIDLDCIANMPSSAFSPSGWSLDQVRAYLMTIISRAERIAYVHLPEAAPKNELENKLVGKALTYLVRDVINQNK